MFKTEDEIKKFIQIRPELDLLFLCSRTNLNQKMEEKILSLLKEDIDWNFFLKTSVEHNVFQLVQLVLNSFLNDIIPEDVLQLMKKKYAENVLHNFLLLKELLKILDLFESHQISVIPYKGPTLSIWGYGGIEFRQFGDIDLFIKKSDFYKIKNLLISQNYFPQYYMDRNNERLHLKFQHELKFIHKKTKQAIEIHWKFSGLCTHFKENPNQIFNFDNLTKIQINNYEVFTFLAEDLFLILCIHAGGHKWSRLLWLCDLNEIIQRNPNLNWEKIFNNAEKLGILRILQVSLILVVEILDTKIPTKIINKLNEKDAILVAIQIVQIFYINNCKDNYLFSKKMIFIKKIRENSLYGYSDLFSFLLSPTPEEWKMVSLNYHLYYFYYFIRPIRLMIKYKLGLSLF